MQTSIKALALSVALLTGAQTLDAMAGPIPAPTITVTGLEYAQPTRAVITVGAMKFESVLVGAFDTRAAGKPDAFETWCVDILQNTYIGSPVSDYFIKTGAQALGAETASLLERLATESLAKVHDATTSAAFQFATWELLAEKSGTFDLSKGDFYAFNVSDGSLALANTWLKNLPGAGSPTTYKLSVLSSATHQDLGTFTKVPEPSTLAALGIGLLGFFGARRRRKS